MSDTVPRLVLDASDLEDLLAAVLAAFRVHAPELDALNVFPVPDGDTGANMLGTVEAAMEGRDVADAVRGAVIGARGNSGVILSQVLRAVLESLDGTLSGSSLPGVLTTANELARAAVAEPVEGTMLTVLRDAADAAESVDGELPDRLVALLPLVGEAVAATEFVLEENRAAGVVDAGARGVEVFLRALHDHVHGLAVEPIDEPDSDAGPAHVVVRDVDQPAEREQGSDEYRWEVQYLLDELRVPDDVAVATLHESLTQVGDSVVVVSAGDLLNVHVHTNQIGGAVEAGLAVGHPRRVAVTDFESELRGAPAALGLVVVLPGAVLANVARADGVEVVAGTSGRLPSVGDLLAAARRTGAPNVVVLPGHRNAVPTATQAAGTSDIELRVVAGADAVPRALAALACWDPEGVAADVAASMDSAADHVRAGEVVAAVRDATTSIGAVARGAALGLVDDVVIASGENAQDVAHGVLAAMAKDGGELLTIIAGATAPANEREALVEHATGLGLDVEVFATDAEPARYWFGIE